MNKLDQSTHFSANDFEYDLDSLKIKNIAILPDEKSTEVFIEKIFPHFPDLYFLSCRGTFPKDEKLRSFLIDRLAHDPELAIVLFNLEAPSFFKIKSRKIFSMDHLLVNSYSGWNAYKIWASDMDELQIIKIMKCFFQQWELMARPGNFSTYYRKYQGIDQEALGWRLDLISADLQPELEKEGDSFGKSP